VNVDKGYLAFLDVLGFSALVSSDHDGKQIERYRDSVKNAIENTDVKSVVFSDSIVLTTNDPRPESLFAIAGACSRLLCDLLETDIALRGAIAYGEFNRSSVGESVFVAGRALIDAYEWERKQDWIGIMIAPSALKTVPNLEQLCLFSPERWKTQPDPDKRWMQFIQRNTTIPFHSELPYEVLSFDGFAVVPTKGNSAADISMSIERCSKHLYWLRMIAPSPASQQKHIRTEGWLNGLSSSWRGV
jgi:hypothetical protein